MLLTFGKYIELLSALDEHCKGTIEKCRLQDAIFNRYMYLHNGSFVAENSRGCKRLFMIELQKTKHNNKERKLFRNFMNNQA